MRIRSGPMPNATFSVTESARVEGSAESEALKAIDWSNCGIRSSTWGSQAPVPPSPPVGFHTSTMRKTPRG